LRASPFDLVALRHQGVADFAVEKDVGDRHKNGLLVCLVHLVSLVSLVQKGEQYGSTTWPN
jgi:hypothetical protein